MLKAIVLFALGFVFLIKGGDWFVDASVSIAKRYHIPEILIGATVVSIGTTIPEVMVSSMAAAMGQSQTAYGNAIGSIICNTSLIAAITLAFSKASSVDTKSLVKPSLFFVAAAVAYIAVSYTTGYFSRAIGIALLLMFLLYMVLTVKEALSTKSVEEEGGEEEENPLWKDIVMLLVGAAVIAVGADFLVDNGQIIAIGIGVTESVVALTFIALGTSLPELITAITSLIKGHSSLSLGNILGANLFNLVLVSGLAISIKPFSIPCDKLIGGFNASLAIDIPLMAGAMALMLVPAFLTKKLRRWQGIVLLCLYASYVAFRFFF